MLDRRSSRAIKRLMLASIVLCLTLLTVTGACDDLFRALGPAFDGLLHDLNHD